MKQHHHAALASAAMPNTRQRLYIRYYVAITADLIVLGLLSQFWDRVQISSFTSGLIAAIMLQLLLQVTLWIAYCCRSHYGSSTQHLNRLKIRPPGKPKSAGFLSLGLFYLAPNWLCYG